MMNLNGKTVLITGASRGIGENAAKEFAAAGANVVLLARSNAAITELAESLGEKAMAIGCDVSDYQQVAQAVARSIERFGTLDVLVNNAGIIEPISHLAEADPEAWGQVIDINLKGVFNGMRAALPEMIAQGGGTILTIGSGAAHGPVEAWSQYCASKAGALMLTKCADKEARDKGIRAISLSPGTVATQMQREIKASGINPISQLDWEVHVPADWPARTLVWMCSEAADPWLGEEISLRDEDIRKMVGLI
jgi:NAD(P)-dependent dehydrogenase (short-subunit alcohol dehydrogenase family)